MGIDRSLIRPMLVQQKDFGVVLRMVDLETKATGLGTGQASLFGKQ